MYYLIVPSKYGDSVAGITVEKVKSKLQNFVTPEETKQKLEVINKDPEQLLIKALTHSVLVGILATLLAYFKIKEFALLAGILVSILWLVIERLIAEQAYRKWQGELFEGIPTLINFFPAFLEVEGVTPRESLALTLPFLPEPLRTEMWVVLDSITRDARHKEALENFANRVKHPCIDSITNRLSSVWNAKVTPDLFDDLMDQVDHIKRDAAKRKTANNTAILALLGVIGVLAVASEFGFPALKYVIGRFNGF